jgi:chromosome partitioning protein
MGMMAMANTSLFALRTTRIIALANQKGGVGKTTTAINLGTALAAVDRSVVIVDLDPQGNASTGLGVSPRARRLSSYDVLTGGADAVAATMETSVPNLSLVPASADLAGVDLELYETKDRAMRLREALRSQDGGIDADYVLIDCPPALSLLTVNAMAAADSVMVPLQCEFFALEGLSQLLDTIERVKGKLNSALTLQGIVLTMYDKRNNLSAQVAEDVRETLGALVYETVIPRNVRLSEAPSHAMPGLIYDHGCAGSQAYLRLAGELLRREADRVAA